MESTAKGKIYFYSSVLFLIFLFLLFDSEWFSSLYALENIDNNIEIAILNSENQLIKYTIAYTFALSLLVLLLIKTFGYYKKIKTSNQFPPPLSNVPFRSKIRYNKNALKIGKGLVFSASLNLIQFIAIFYISITFMYKNHIMILNM